ncbi:MAG: PHP domain-containing protein [Acidobacteria bacterium]|nr:PHP domain-containing protein [Acidobacteriota bacterium]
MNRRTLSVQNPDASPHPGRPSPLIDLHLHSTASDGVDAPEALVANCASAGLSVVAVTDHDTTAAIPAAEAAARCAGLGFVSGIEITAVWRRKDVHVLGYFFDPLAPALAAFLADQRRDRIRRARVIGVRLASMGVPIDIEQVIASAGDRPVSRPAIAQALVDAGHVQRRQDAFQQYVGERAPAYEPRAGVTVRRAIRIIKDAGGIASLAHPGVAGIDRVIADLAGAGLDALEVYHADHADADTSRYLALARRLNLGVTGGSDYHGDQSHHPGGLGRFVLPARDFDDLCRRAGLRGITL